MASILTELGNGIRSSFRRQNNTPITKTQLAEFITDTRSEISQAKQILTLIDPAFSAKLAARLKTKPLGKQEGLKLYKGFLGKLQGKAASEEGKATFASLSHALDICDSTLTKILKQLDTLFEAKAISLYNVNISQTVVLGILTESIITNKYTKFMLVSLFHDMSELGTRIPTYRSSYLSRNTQLVANVVNRTYAKSGMINMEQILMNIRKSNNNVQLVSTGDDKLANIGSIAIGKMNNSAMLLIKNAIPALNIFGWLGEKWNMYQHNRYLAKKAEMEWMSTHVELLKMEMSEVVSEEEKARLEKIIATYDAMISKLDKEIADYEISA